MTGLLEFVLHKDLSNIVLCILFDYRNSLTAMVEHVMMLENSYLFQLVSVLYLKVRKILLAKSVLSTVNIVL